MIRTVILVFVVLLVSCNSGKTPIEKIELIFNGCMEKEESKLITKGVVLFEEILMEYYNVEENKLNNAYRQFLEEASAKTLGPDIYMNPKTVNMLKEMKESGLSSKIYSSEDQGGVTLYNLNFSGDFVDCIKKNNELTDEMRDYISSIEEFPNTSFSLCAGGLLTALAKKEFSFPLTKVIVAYDIFYRMALTFE